MIAIVKAVAIVIANMNAVTFTFNAYVYCESLESIVAMELHLRLQRDTVLDGRLETA
jgi:hypothetical protein